MWIYPSAVCVFLCIHPTNVCVSAAAAAAAVFKAVHTALFCIIIMPACHVCILMCLFIFKHTDTTAYVHVSMHVPLYMQFEVAGRFIMNARTHVGKDIMHIYAMQLFIVCTYQNT